MNRHMFEVMALDKDFNLVSLLRYYNLQWRRKWYESGSFSIQIPLEQYDPDIKYIYTKDRPEVGEVSQINYVDKNGRKMFALSGYFLENELNRRVVYINSTSNILNAPTWINKSGAAEDVAYDFFNAFKDVNISRNGTKQCPLGIASSTSQSRGKQSDHTRQGEYLGDKIYSILKPSEMSYVIDYKYVSNTKTFKVVKGLDLTQGNDSNNNPVVFSTRYGNLNNPNVLWSEAKYKNAYVATHTYNDNDVEYAYSQADVEAEESDLFVSFINVKANLNHGDYSSQSDYLDALATEGHTEILEKIRTVSFDFDAIEGSYDYLTDFNLGDKCSLEVKEIGLSVDAVLTACTEVIKNGNWTLSLEFDV